MQLETELQNTTIWFTGLPCSGKTTLCESLLEKLRERELHVTHLDGDQVRKGLCAGLGFTPDGRSENLRRISHICKLFNDADVMVLASFVSPVEDYRHMIRGIVGNIKLVYVKCSAEKCEERDVKGMYALARQGKIIGFTGVGAEFEEPANPDLVLETDKMTVEECVDLLLKTLID